ncbi:transcriptional initiation protein Tat [Phaeobacter gallaeciensis]|uniref:Transcriptional initiation protein Tat n=1 Tax=Phaeobacter gallaeciensis TaxID=60890 RepID=A0A366WUN5_9RHOB|nr:MULTISPECIES: PhoX family phosphatase [Roseobacteraceae]MBT8171165.1 PhoX family phosphatase [Falsiruegeria litorea]RBW51772.1 transcriptional initiation protein Tat [Phaeobacter gallaeciensis]
MKDDHTLSFDEFDETVNPRSEHCEFDTVVEQAISRRGFLGGVLAVGGFATLGGAVLPTGVKAAVNRFAFDAVPVSTSDSISVPAGYKAEVVVRWADAMWSDSVAFDQDTRGTAKTQARTFGDNTDGMEVFMHEGRTLLTINNEYTNRSIIWGNRADAKPENDDDIEKGLLAHGVTVVEIGHDGDRWGVVIDSPFNRRITPNTEMILTGPAAGHALVKTDADPAGITTLGTWNNCGSGKTPWGTYLACEENFNGYFSAEDENHEVSAELKRYGVSASDWGYSWAKIDDRFDVAKNPNEPNRVGYVVEIDPRDANSTPKKRTALGRFKHENAECVVNNDGRLVIYMGDDERGEFLYRYVSDGVYAAGVDTDALMENGTIFAAKFHDTGAGEWLALTPETTGMTQAEICVHTRIAASKVGATTMDRPEWVTANPNSSELYCALTNNKNRGLKTNKGGDETPVGGPNPREKNKYGQIVRWTPMNDDHTSAEFKWDLYVLAGNPKVHSDDKAGSENVNLGNMFNSPDGLAFDSTGQLWIQTDGKYSNEGDFEGQGNNQMLAGDPVTGEIRRFLVGPREAEVTGLCWSGDRKTMFVGIQHPGERGNSNWPDGGNTVPRSAIIAVTRDDGGLVG